MEEEEEKKTKVLQFLPKNCVYLEYNDIEIHSLLLALLERKNIEPYRSKLISYEAVNPITDYKFHVVGAMREGVKQFDLYEGNDLRSTSPAIFSYNEKVFVNIYPTTLPQKIKGLTFNNFKYKINEAVFELENFLEENQNLRGQEVIFTIPINKGNTHWVECTIKIDKTKIFTGFINDPFGKPGISAECYNALKKILFERFSDNIRHIGTLHQFGFYGSNEFLPNIQRDLYCGGATRRMRDATIFSPNNDPYDWREIDHDKPSKITIKFKNSLKAREADLELLIRSHNEEIKRVGENLHKKYQIYNYVFQLKKKKKNQTNCKFFK